MPPYPQLIQHKYSRVPGDAALVFESMCQVLNGGEDQARWEGFRDEEWRLFSIMARTEGTAPLLYQKITSSGGDLFSILEQPGLLQELKQEYIQSTARSRLLSGELARVLEAFDARDISWILLKGSAYGLLLYDEAALRPIGDVDLLVEPADLDRCRAALRELDFRMTPELAALEPGLRQLIHSEVNYDGGNSIPLRVELHWSLTGSRGMKVHHPMDWFWSEGVSRPVSEKGFSQTSVRVLSPTASLLYAAHHMISKHPGLERRLVWYYDLVLMLEKWSGEIDREALIRKAEEYRWTGNLREVFQDLDYMTGHSYQEYTGAIPAAGEASGESEAVVRPLRVGADPFRDMLAQLSDLTLAARLRLIAALVFPTPRYLKWRYGFKAGWKTVCYYPYRLLHVAGMVVSSLFRK